MSNIPVTPSKKSSSCLGVIVTAIVVTAYLAGLAWIVVWAVSTIRDYGVSFWPVFALLVGFFPIYWRSK